MAGMKNQDQLNFSMFENQLAKFKDYYSTMRWNKKEFQEAAGWLDVSYRSGKENPIWSSGFSCTGELAYVFYAEKPKDESKTDPPAGDNEFVE
jgi:hypothetical protein